MDVNILDLYNNNAMYCPWRDVIIIIIVKELPREELLKYLNNI